MAGTMEFSTVRVEGKDDKWALVNLLIHHGVDYDHKRGALPEFKECDSVEQLLDGMELQIRLHAGRQVAFVLDADMSLESRWQAVRDRLAKVQVEAPEVAPAGGFIGTSAEFNTSVGVWLMPDNLHDGKLETFLQSLVDTSDSLIGLAESSTGKAKEEGAEFSEPDRIKAVIHCWLAWKKEPGLPFGTAIRAKYFQHDSDAAVAFVAWFKNLFSLE